MSRSSATKAFAAALLLLALADTTTTTTQVAAQTTIPGACSSKCTTSFDSCIEFNTKGLEACLALSKSTPYSTCNSYYGNYLESTCKLGLLECVSKCK